jgi:hypothetical protein
MRESYQPPNELTYRHVLGVKTQTGEPVEETTAQAIDRLIGQMPVGA